jgi:aspartate racemase
LYHSIIEYSQKKYAAAANSEYPELLIYSLPIPDFISDTTQVPVAENMLQDAVHSLEKAGCTHLCIASNTVHILLERLAQKTTLPFISIITAVAKRCTHLGFRKVGLLGTPTLLKSGLYADALAAVNIELLYPNQEQLQLIETVIRSVLAGESLEGIAGEYQNTISALLAKGCDSVILGCTELPLALASDSILRSKIVDSDEILAQAIGDIFYENKN